MGGLDARHMIVDGGMAERVATLTTIGTPHYGSPVADRIAQVGGSLFLQVLDRVLDVDGVADLTTSACEQFNIRAESSEAGNRVVYQTYSAWKRKDRDLAHPRNNSLENRITIDRLDKSRVCPH